MSNQKLAEEAAERVAEQAQFIAEAVGTQAKTTNHTQSSTEALQDHWWVKCYDGKRWVDLDPTLPSVTAKAQKTIPFTQKLRLDSKLCHEVHLRVVIEQWQEGSLKTRPVLNQTLRPSELFGQPVKLSYYPINWPKDFNMFQDQQAFEKLKATAAEQKEWLPVLTVGSRNISKQAFSDSGDVKDKPGKDPVGGLGDKFGDLFGGFNGSQKKKTGYLTAAWVEYEIHSPGKPAQTMRRDIFDLLGAALRATEEIPEPTITEAQRLERGLSLLMETEILILCCKLSSEFVQYLALEIMLANQKTLPDLIRYGLPKKSEDVAEIGKLKRLPGRLYNLAMVRHAWSQFQSDIYLSTPNILTSFAYMGSGGKYGLRLYKGFDIVANEVAVRPGTEVDPFLIRLRQGILDTNAEALLMQSAQKIENTAELFMKSSSQGTQWLTIRSAQDPAWQKVELSEDVRARIGQDLANGYVVLVPQKPLAMEEKALTGWWRVDPVSGHLLGFMGSGKGQAMTEYIVNHILLFGPFYFGLFMGWIGCAGFKDPRNNTASKNLLCLMCALISAICFELVWIGKLAAPIVTTQCGMLAGFLGLGSCGIGGAM